MIVYRESRIGSLAELRQAIEAIEQLAADQGLAPDEIRFTPFAVLTLREPKRGEYRVRVT